MDYYRSRDMISSQHYLTLAQLAKADLMSVANIVSSRHIKDFFVKARFIDDVSKFADHNLELIKKSKNEKDHRYAFDNIKEESRNISNQGTMLSLEQAKVFMTVSMEKYNKEIGYISDGFGVLLGAGQVLGGAGLFLKSASLIGRIGGVYISLNGASSFYQKIMNLLGNERYVGFMEGGYIYTAEFLGFDKKYGSMAYHAADMASSLYGISALRLKPSAHRLFYYLPEDYYRKFSTMSRAALGLKFLGAGNKIRIISDINKEIER